MIGVLPDKVRETQKRFLQHIDTAAILGSKVTIGLMRGLGTEVTKSQDLHNLSEALKPLIEYADKKGVILLLEAINRY